MAVIKHKTARSRQGPNQQEGPVATEPCVAGTFAVFNHLRFVRYVYANA